MSLFCCILIYVLINAIFYICKRIIIVQEQEVVIIERSGRYFKTLNQGIHFIPSFFDYPRFFIQPKKIGKDGKNSKKWMWYRVLFVSLFPLLSGKNSEKWMYSPGIDLRETTLEYQLKGAITRDGAVININIFVYFQIIDARRAVYSVCNLYAELENLINKTAQNMVNELCIDEILSAKPKLIEIISEKASGWGIKVNDIILSDLSLSGY